jgi:hypothetical protein
MSLQAVQKVREEDCSESTRFDFKVKGEFLLRCLVNNIRKIVRKVLASAITLEELRLARTAGVMLAKAG